MLCRRSSSGGEAAAAHAGGSGDDQSAAERLTRGSGAALSPLLAGALNASPATFSLSGGAVLCVRYGLAEVAGLGLHHVQPNVFYEPVTRTACVFSGE